MEKVLFYARRSDADPSEHFHVMENTDGSRELAIVSCKVVMTITFAPNGNSPATYAALAKLAEAIEADSKTNFEK